MALTGDGGSGDGLNLPRTDKETMQDPRTDLERLPSGNLYGVARNAAAVHRHLAIQLLVERASPFAGRDEIAAEEIVPILFAGSVELSAVSSLCYLGGRCSLRT
jgi:hypothetical protein